MNDAAPERSPASEAAPAAPPSRARAFFSFLDRPWHPAVTLALAAGALALSAVALLFPPASFLAPAPSAPRVAEKTEPATDPPPPAHPEAGTDDPAAVRAPAHKEEEEEEHENRGTVAAKPDGDTLSDADAVRTAARRELLRAAETAATGAGELDESEAWLYLAEVRRGAGDEQGALEAMRRRDAILAERRTRAAFLEQLRIVSESLGEDALLAAPEPLLEPETDGDFEKARIRLYAMLARSGDLSGGLGAVAPDVSMAIADTYRDEALRALEGKKAAAPPRHSLWRDEPGSEATEEEPGKKANEPDDGGKR